MFQALDQFVKAHGDGAENQNRGDHHVELEYLRSIDDQVSQTSPGGKKFTDDDANQRKSDVDLHIAEDQRNRGWKDDLKESVSPVATQRIDQFEHFGVCLAEACVETDNGAKYGNRDTGDNDRVGPGAEPYDQKRGKSRFGKGVQYNEIGFQDLRQTFLIPEKSRTQQTEESDKEEAQHCFKQCDPGVREEGVIPQHLCKIGENGGRAAEKETVNPCKTCGSFPE